MEKKVAGNLDILANGERSGNFDIVRKVAIGQFW